jgi:hypothetical protein
MCTWLGCHALAGLDSLTVGEEESEGTTTGRGGSGGTPSATSAGGGSTVTMGPGGTVGTAGMGGAPPSNDCCIAHPGSGCSGTMTSSVTASSSSGGMQMMCQYCVCMQMSTCCSTEWTQACADIANTNCQSPCGC